MTTPAPPAPVPWADPARSQAFEHWLHAMAAEQGLRPDSLRLASADASFRRYLRIDGLDGKSRIIMDAPPEKEDCRPFVQVAALMRQAGVHAPEVLAWDEPQGFMLLTDLGAQTLMQVITAAGAPTAVPQRGAPTHELYMGAIDALLRWQLASRPEVLPPYDDALLSRELALFDQWYVKGHRRLELGAQCLELAVQGVEVPHLLFDLIVASPDFNLVLGHQLLLALELHVDVLYRGLELVVVCECVERVHLDA